MPFRTYATVLILAATTITVACGTDDSTDSGTASTTTAAMTTEDGATTDEATSTSAAQTNEESTTTTATAETTTTSDASTATSATGNSVPNACDVLTAEEFTAVMGSPSTSATINEGEPACEFAVTGKGIVVRLSVVGGMTADAIVSQVNPSEFKPVTGIGEKMYVSNEGRQAVMKSGDAGYQLTRWEGTVTADQLTELMRSIVAG